MMTLIKKLVLILSVSLIITGCVSQGQNPEPDDDDMEDIEQLNEGELAVSFEFTDFDGNTVTLNDLKGDKVYLKFMASWCSICNRGMPELNDLFAKDRDFVAYAVVTPNANGEMSVNDYKDWFDKESYPNIVVLFDVNAKFSRRLGAISMPTSVFIGSDGVLIRSKPGHTSNEEIETLIKTFK
jgi:thiol-disulfide isomerase/thioredoxin